jgi:hypothetical protein
MRTPLDSNAVAVMPFEVAGAAPELLSLEEGLPDLLFSTLTGDGTVRVANVQLLLRKWREMEARGQTVAAEAPLRLAADLGAGLLLTGSATQAGPTVTVNAWLQRVPEGTELAQHSFSVPLDSTTRILTGVVYGLLGDQLGEDGERLKQFADQDPEAVKAYVDGVRAEREGNPVEALIQYEEAEGLDSSFALPVLRIGHLSWRPTLKPGEPLENWIRRWTQSLVRARDLRHNLGPRDRALLWFNLVNLGMPVDSTETAVANLAATKRWASYAPDDAEAQLQLADWLFSAGAITSEPMWWEQYRAARDSAWMLDSVTPDRVIAHAFLSLKTGDREWARRVLPALVRVDSSSERWVGVRWGMAHLLDDSVTVRDYRARAQAGDRNVLKEGTGYGLANGRGHFPTDDLLLFLDQTGQNYWHLMLPAGRAVRAAQAENLSPYQAVEFSYAYPELEESAQARAALCERFFESAASLLPGFDRQECRDRPIAMVAAAHQAAFVRDSALLRSPCYALLHRARSGDTVDVRAAARRLLVRYRRGHRLGICPAMVEAFVESHDTARTDTPALDTLEALMRTGPGMEWPAPTGMLVVTRLARQRGQLERALDAAGDGCCWGGAFSDHARAPLLREEGELATILGDTARAIEAFKKYLNIRVDPDPGVVQAEVDSVRAALDRLVGEGRE